VFSTTGKTPASGFSHAKARLHAPMLAAERERLRAAGRTREADELMLQSFTLHDLRRTATTGMARLGTPPHIADRILNHQAGTIRGVATVYNRFEYLEERKAALEPWGRHVEALVRLLPSNVVPLALAR
jgi:integrase